MKVFVSIVTYNSAEVIERCLDGLIAQDGFEVGKTLKIHLVDNQSADNTFSLVCSRYVSKLFAIKSNVNLGFCAANNLAVARFLDSDCDCLLLLNPDLYLEKDALRIMVEALGRESKIGAVCPRLLKAGLELKPIRPMVIDACGMELTRALRHFDRGSGELEKGLFLEDQYVFGGSGACLLMKREMVEDCLLRSDNDNDLGEIYPELLENIEQRAALFDEAFFAYREDADLAWRAQILGWQCLYVAKAIGYHKRTVVPENRDSLPPTLNLYSVRNRFLLQLNNYSFREFPGALLPGLVVRNLIVILAVLFREQSSIPAFGQLKKLYARALHRRKQLFEKASARDRRVNAPQ